MNVTHESSPWAASLDDRFPQATGTLNYRFVIVGAGIVGVAHALTLADELKRSESKDRILLLDAGLVFSGISHLQAGMITRTFDKRYDEILDEEGEDALIHRFGAGYEAQQYLFDLIGRFGGACGFNMGASRYGAYDDGESQESLAGLWRGAAVAKTGADLVQSAIGADSPFARYMLFPEEGNYNPALFAYNALTSELGQYIDVRANSPVQSIEVQDEQVLLKTRLATIIASKVVLATAKPTLLSCEQLDQLFSTEWVASVALKYNTPLNLKPELNYFDTPWINTFRIVDGNTLLLLGEGPNLDEGESKESYIEDLLAFATEHFGAEFVVSRVWCGGLVDTDDQMPIGGEHPDHAGRVHLALGTGGTGNVNAFVLALMNAARMLGREPVEFDSLFNVERFIR
jgi:glycine/D-amino acid oxidase-like deaminating enzyme